MKWTRIIIILIKLINPPGQQITALIEYGAQHQPHGVVQMPDVFTLLLTPLIYHRRLPFAGIHATGQYQGHCRYQHGNHHVEPNVHTVGIEKAINIGLGRRLLIRQNANAQLHKWHRKVHHRATGLSNGQITDANLCILCGFESREWLVTRHWFKC